MRALTSLTVLASALIAIHSDVGAEPKVPQTIVAEQCAVVLNDVRAGRDISINVQCDVPTEKQILTKVMSDAFSTECFYATPENWAKVHPAASVELQSIPRSGSYFAQFDFRYIVYQAPQSEPEKAFLFGEEVILDGEKLSPWMKANHARVIALRKTSPGPIIPYHVMHRAQGFDYFTTNEALASAPVRANVANEGSRVEKGQLFAFKEENLVAQILVYPTPNSYPRLSDPVIAYTFRCEADVKMKPKTFVDLCAGLIERTTLNNAFGQRTCKLSGSGAVRKYMYNAARE